MQFVLIFVAAISQAESGRTAAEHLLSLIHCFKQLNLGKINLKVYKKVLPKPLNTLMTLSIVGVSNKLQHYLIYNSCFLDILFSLRCS